MNPKRSPAQVLSAIFGFMLLAVSTPCVLAMLNDLFIVGTDNTTGALIIGSFMGFVGLAGMIMMFFGLRKPAERPIGLHRSDDKVSLERAFQFLDVDRSVVSRELEREVLEVAREHGGRITVADLAVGTDLKFEECKRLLDYLVGCDAAQTHLTSAGDIVYVFSGFTADKASAYNPLDDHAAFDAALEATDDEVQFDAAMQGADGDVEFDHDEQDEVAVAQQHTQSEEW